MTAHDLKDRPATPVAPIHPERILENIQQTPIFLHDSLELVGIPPEDNLLLPVGLARLHQLVSSLTGTSSGVQDAAILLAEEAAAAQTTVKPEKVAELRAQLQETERALKHERAHAAKLEATDRTERETASAKMERMREEARTAIESERRSRTQAIQTLEQEVVRLQNEIKRLQEIAERSTEAHRQALLEPLREEITRLEALSKTERERPAPVQTAPTPPVPVQAPPAEPRPSLIDEARLTLLIAQRQTWLETTAGIQADLNGRVEALHSEMRKLRGDIARVSDGKKPELKVRLAAIEPEAARLKEALAKITSERARIGNETNRLSSLAAAIKIVSSGIPEEMASTGVPDPKAFETEESPIELGLRLGTFAAPIASPPPPPSIPPVAAPVQAPKMHPSPTPAPPEQANKPKQKLSAKDRLALIERVAKAQGVPEWVIVTLTLFDAVPPIKTAAGTKRISTLHTVAQSGVKARAYEGLDRGGTALVYDLRTMSFGTQDIAFQEKEGVRGILGPFRHIQEENGQEHRRVYVRMDKPLPWDEEAELILPPDMRRQFLSELATRNPAIAKAVPA